MDRWTVRSLDHWIQIRSAVMVGGEDFTREVEFKTFLIFVYLGTCEQ